MRPCDIDDVPSHRLTQVHWRYWIHGYFGDEGELYETCARKAEALAWAKRLADGGVRHFERTVVVDTMARKGARSIWEFRPKVQP